MNNNLILVSDENISFMRIENRQKNLKVKYISVDTEAFFSESVFILPTEEEKLFLENNKKLVHRIYKKHLDSKIYENFPLYVIDYYHNQETDYKVSNDLITLNNIKIDKYPCSHCSSLAVWDYEPSYIEEDGSIIPKNSYYCDKHVPRGCSCNDYKISYYDDREKFIQVLKSETNPEDAYIYHSSKKELDIITGVENILDYIKELTDEELDKYYVSSTEPCVEYGHNKNGFVVYENLDYSFNPDR